MPTVNDGVIAVTGASGFIGSHIVKQLLEGGYQVRAIVRDMRPEKIEHLQAMASEPNLTFATADVTDVQALVAAFTGVTAVIHTAAAVLLLESAVKDWEQEVVRPAVLGTTNAVEAAKQCPTVRRFVLTSSFSTARDFGHEGQTIDESVWNTWSTVARKDGYSYAKTTAEKQFWAAAKDCKFECVSLLPAFVLGAPLNKLHTKASPIFVRQIIYGNPQINLQLSWVGVNDVARAHVLALRREEAAGARILLINDEQAQYHDVKSLGPLCQSLFPDYQLAYVPAFNPWLLGFLSWAYGWVGSWALSDFNYHNVNNTLRFSNARSKELLGLTYEPMSSTVRETVEGMVTPGWIKPKPRR